MFFCSRVGHLLASLCASQQTFSLSAAIVATAPLNVADAALTFWARAQSAPGGGDAGGAPRKKEAALTGSLGFAAARASDQTKGVPFPLLRSSVCEVDFQSCQEVSS